MAIKAECDRCGRQKKVVSSQSVPINWRTLVIKQDGQSPFEKLLCQGCVMDVQRFVDSYLRDKVE